MVYSDGMNEINDKVKIDINGSLHDAVGEAATEVTGIFIVALIVGVLIAPAFGSWIESALKKQYSYLPYEDRYPVINAKMAKAYIVLWTVSLIAWAAVIGTYISYRLS